jgi:hypothetical protein
VMLIVSAVVIIINVVAVAVAATTTTTTTSDTRAITYLETQRSVSSVRETRRIVRVGLVPVRTTSMTMVWKAVGCTVGWSLGRWLIVVA